MAEGLEFSDFRQYRPGDDFRHIDWNIYSRLDQLFLKLHASEEDLTLHLVVDASASMGFGEPSKFDHARRLAAALAYIALHNLDRVGVSVFAEASARPAPHQSAEPHGPTARFSARAALCRGDAFRRRDARLRDGTRSPGLVILISDLLGAEDTQDAQDGIEALCHAGHDVVVVQLLAESEIDPPFDGALRLVDAETGEELDVTVDRRSAAALPACSSSASCGRWSASAAGAAWNTCAPAPPSGSRT